MSSHPTISIIIPTRNRRRLLQEAIASVLAQTFANWELIVIDDASEDETWPWLSSIREARVKKIRLAHHAERCAARNTGLEAAVGEFVLFLDDDDLLPASALQAHLDALKKNPKAIASVGGYVVFDRHGTEKRVRIIRRRRVCAVWQDVMFGWVAISGQCLFRAQALKAVNGWDVTFNVAEDQVLWLQMARLGPAVLLPELVLKYRIHDGQWRPRKYWHLMTKLRQRAVKTINGKERELAERILAAREAHAHACKLFEQGMMRQALALFLKIPRLAPSLLHSPLIRPQLLQPIVKCLLGGKPVFAWLQRWSKKREIDYGAAVDDEQDHGAPAAVQPALK
jgi:glycosyltransferase involved in cell wall biosynthesis